MANKTGGTIRQAMRFLLSGAWLGSTILRIESGLYEANRITDDHRCHI